LFVKLDAYLQFVMYYSRVF